MGWKEVEMGVLRCGLGGPSLCGERRWRRASVASRVGHVRIAGESAAAYSQGTYSLLNWMSRRPPSIRTPQRPVALGQAAPAMAMSLFFLLILRLE